MRLAPVLLVLLLAGCATPAPTPPTEASRPPAPEPSTADVRFGVTSGMQFCAGPSCTYLGGGADTYEFARGNYTALDLSASVGQDIQSQQLAPLRPVAFSLVCHAGTKGGCAGWKNIEASGAFPVHLAASNFTAGPKDRLTFTVRYTGSDPVALGGSGCSYDVVGSVTGVDAKGN